MLHRIGVITAIAATAVLKLAAVDAAHFRFVNRCPFVVNLWDNRAFNNIAPLTGMYSTYSMSKGLMWRHGYDPQATLAEITVDLGRVWYDISIIPPGTGDCNSFTDCRRVANGRTGFNVAMAIVPRSNRNGANCRTLFCLANGCSDAYLYPADNLKVHNCPDTTAFDIVFCPGSVGTPTASSAGTEPSLDDLPPGDYVGTDDGTGDDGIYDDNHDNHDNHDDEYDDDNANNQAPTRTPAPASAPPALPSASYVKAKFEYRGQQAGNVPGSYNMLTNLATCSRQPVYMSNPVGPLSEEVSMVFRGPMEIYNIAVFGASFDGWHRMSSYTRNQMGENLVFMANKNVDYSGQRSRGPQIFASSDGRSSSSVPVPFSGSLAEASSPSNVGGGPGVDTGVEVNIMTGQKCNNDCRGFHDNTYSYHGWGGDRKIFITRVLMPMSGKRPNLPAIWMLNTQAMYAGQYDVCNCRGIGATGGCGELDIAEVIDNQNPGQDRISTHHYFYDGSVPNPPRGDNFASRPMSRTATYVTIIDSTVASGLIKIVEIDWFNFALRKITQAQVQAWINS